MATVKLKKEAEETNMYSLQLLSEISYLAVGYPNNTKHWGYLLLGILSSNDVYGNENVTSTVTILRLLLVERILYWLQRTLKMDR